ncbi:hypothetical protein DFH06DRAFT_1251020, partial [Mycena polygramma]
MAASLWSCFAQSLLDFPDVCLGLDWKAGVREWMIGLGLPPPIGFDHVHAIDPLGACSLLFLSAHISSPSAHAAVSAKSIHLSDAVAASRPSAPGLPPAPSAGHLLPSESLAYARGFSSAYAHGFPPAYAQSPHQPAYAHGLYYPGFSPPYAEGSHPVYTPAAQVYAIPNHYEYIPSP